MRRIIFYIEVSGEIDSIEDYGDDADDADIEADVPDGCDWLEGDADPDTDYILAGVVTERPDVAAEEVYHVDADGVERTLFTMPDPTVVTYRGQSFMAGGVYLDLGGGNVLDVNGDYLVVSSDDDLAFKFKSMISGEFEYLLEPEFPYKSAKVTVIADAV